MSLLVYSVAQRSEYITWQNTLWELQGQQFNPLLFCSSVHLCFKIFQAFNFCFSSNAFEIVSAVTITPIFCRKCLFYVLFLSRINFWLLLFSQRCHYIRKKSIKTCGMIGNGVLWLFREIYRFSRKSQKNFKKNSSSEWMGWNVRS